MGQYFVAGVSCIEIYEINIAEIHFSGTAMHIYHGYF